MRRQWRAANKEAYLAQTKRHNDKYRKANEESVKAKQKEWRTNNTENNARIKAHNIARKRKIKLAGTIAIDYLPQIEEFYKEARRLTEETGVKYVVDHYWPINGKGSCGLHVPWNLRVITQRENDSKGNKEPEDTWSSVITDQGDKTCPQ